MAVAQRSGANPAVMGHILFGPAPDSDTGLLQLAHDLDDIERQVSHS
ncbi:putative membrane protein [Mycobacterium talmoniae]|nr:putative membrane protein [Mycobacterium talmoniae]